MVISQTEPTVTGSAPADDIAGAVTVYRPAPLVFLTQWRMPTAATATDELDRLSDVWRAADMPWWLRSVSFYQSVDSTTCLMYAVCDPAHTLEAPDHHLPTGYTGRRLADFRLECRMAVDTAGDVTGRRSPCPVVVVASFDVDGPERQQAVIGSVIDRISRSAESDQKGLISANFHTSMDGLRVLNLAEWTTDEAHERFMGSRSRTTNLKTTTGIPGVRPIGFVRYHLRTHVVGQRAGA